MTIRKLEPTAQDAPYTGEHFLTSALSDWVEGIVERLLAPLTERVERLEYRANHDWRPLTVDTEGACRMLCCGVDKLRRLRNDGELAYYDYMGTMVYDVASLEAFLARHRVPADAS